MMLTIKGVKKLKKCPACNASLYDENGKSQVLCWVNPILRQTTYFQCPFCKFMIERDPKELNFNIPLEIELREL